MKNLIELVKILTRRKISKIEILDPQTIKDQSNFYTQFYNGILSGEFKSERDVSQKIYGTNELTTKFRKLKSRFTKRVLNTFFFININEEKISNIDKALIICQKQLALTHILLYYKAKKTAKDVAKKTLTTSRKFEIHFVSIQLAQILRNLSIQENDKKQVQSYSNLIKDLISLIEVEEEVRNLISDIKLLYEEGTISPKNIEVINQKSDRISHLGGQVQSAFINQKDYEAWLIRKNLEGAFQDIIEMSDHFMINIMDKPEIYKINIIPYIRLHQIKALLQMSNFDQAEKLAKSAQEQLQKSHSTYLEFTQTYLRIALNEEKYFNAFAIFESLKGEDFLMQISKPELEKWEVCNLLIHFIVWETPNRILKIEKKAQLQSWQRQVFIQKELPDIKSFGELELHICFLKILLHQEKRKIQAYIEMLKAYCAKNASKQKIKRLRLFSKCLSNWERTNFSATKFHPKSASYKNLCESSFYYNRKGYTFEAIRFEKLLVRVLKAHSTDFEGSEWNTHTLH